MSPGPSDVPQVPPRRRMTADARRTQLLETAREVFLQQGFDGTTVRDISEAAGVNIALLYRHFDSKEILFEEAIWQPLVETLDDFVTLAGEATRYAGRDDVQRAIVGQLMRQLLDAMLEITPLLGIVLFSPRGRDFYRDRFAPAIGLITTAADAAKPHWEHREYDTDTLSMIIIGKCFMYGLRTAFDGEPFDPDAVSIELTTLIFDGLAAH